MSSHNFFQRDGKIRVELREYHTLDLAPGVFLELRLHDADIGIHLDSLADAYALASAISAQHIAISQQRKATQSLAVPPAEALSPDLIEETLNRR